MIQVNTVLQRVKSQDNKKIERQRVIWKDEEYVFLVDLSDEGSLPFMTTVDELEMGLDTGKLVIIPDPFARTWRDEDIPSSLRVARDKDWDLVQCLWTKEPIAMLTRSTRSKLVRQACDKFLLPKYKVDRLIKRFWQRGMTKNALLLDYNNCGHPGKNRQSTEKKRGRPPQYRDPDKVGINIGETELNLFRLVIDTKYRTKQKPTLTDAYNYLLDTYFSTPYTENGEKKVKRWSKERRPTYTQFRYWYLKEKNEKQDYIDRHSEREFNLKLRELLGDSTSKVSGPGSEYQVDATIADVYLVSSLDRTKIIGRPIVYVAIDTYSRMVAGIYVGLEGPSWVGAMMLIDNIVDDKVAFCRKYDINISEEEWPCQGLPERIIADGGEMEGLNADNLINNLNVEVDITPPYRGDLKGIVERHFRTVNDRIKHMLPGAIDREYRQRCEEDHRLKAELTVKEFTALMIRDVLWHNKHVMTKYPLSTELHASGVIPKPIVIWRWGMENKKGCFHSFPREIVRLNLLPRAKVSILRQGIKFEGRYYSFGKALAEGWFINPKRRSEEIAYDPRDISVVYLPTKDGKSFSIANLLEKSEDYANLYWEEARFHNELLAERLEDAADEESQNNADHDMATRAILKNAKLETNKQKRTKPKTSKAQKTKNISSNRLDEKAQRREDEQFNLGVSQPPKPGEVLPFLVNGNETSSHQSSHGIDPETSAKRSKLEMMAKRIEEKLGKDIE